MEHHVSVPISEGEEIISGVSSPINEEKPVVDGRDCNLCSCIIRRLDVPCPLWSTLSTRIFKVPAYLRNVNSKAYEPYILAIGPYHRGKKNLSMMEDVKMQYLHSFLRSKGEENREQNLIKYFSGMRELEKQARDIYADSIDIGTDGFVEMMLLDACFIVELLRKLNGMKSKDDCDPVMKEGWIMANVGRDLLLVENQLPLFVLQKFLLITRRPGDKSLSEMIFTFLYSIVPKLGHPDHSKNEIAVESQEINHIPSLLEHSWLNLFNEQKKSSSRNESSIITACVNSEVIMECTTEPLLKESERAETESASEVSAEEDGRNNLKIMRSASELREFGIEFKKVNRGNLSDIEFKNGRMEIPTLTIDDNSESIFRNLIVYEQFSQSKELHYVTDYILFMDRLMNSSKDVELLRQSEIIENGLGDDEVVADMFNRLLDNVSHDPSRFYYFKLCYNVNRHCQKRRNKWVASLRHDYFSSPWALISVLAAIFLLLLTVIQTVFVVLTYLE